MWTPNSRDSCTRPVQVQARPNPSTQKRGWAHNTTLVFEIGSLTCPKHAVFADWLPASPLPSPPILSGATELHHCAMLFHGFWGSRLRFSNLGVKDFSCWSISHCLGSFVCFLGLFGFKFSELIYNNASLWYSFVLVHHCTFLMFTLVLHFLPST